MCGPIAILRYKGTNKRKHSCLTQQFMWVAQLESTPAHRAGDLASNPGPSKIFSLKITNHDAQMGGLNTKFSLKNQPKCSFV